MKRAVTAVVVTWNSAEVLPGFLASLSGSMEGVGSWRLVVADNDSTDGTVDIVSREAPGATLVRTGRNAGYAAGVNAGVGAAGDAGAVLICNPDLRLEPGSVQRLLDTLAEPGTGIAVPRLVDGDGVPQPSLRREPTVRRALGEALLGGHRAGRFAALGEMVTDPGAYERPGTADWATGAAMLVSRECLDAVGPWDESFFLYSEETDFALRARDAGFVLRYVPDATAVHIGGESGVSPRLWGILTANRLRLFRTRHGRLHSAAFGAAVALNEAIRALTGSAVHRAGLRAALRTPKPASSPAGAPGYICFSAQDFWYHNRAHSDIQLMRHVAAQRPVLFVNSIGMRMPLPGRSTQPLRRLARKLRSMAKFVRRPLPGTPAFRVMTPIMLPFYGSRPVRSLNARLVRAQVGLVARALGIRHPVVVVTIPTAWDVVRDMPRQALVVNRSDCYSSFPEADQALIRGLEEQLLGHADHVLYVSHALQDEEAPLVNGRAVFLDHGVDLEHFRPREAEPEPADLASIPRPRIGFFGALDDYLVDFALLERVAREIPEAQLVLVGDANCAMEELLALPNVHWLGFRPYEHIPRYGSGFDVALMPWLDNEWIRASNPIKLKEYLALGLPVVSVDFPEVRRYAQCVGIAPSGDDFVAMTRAALGDAAPAARAARRAAVARSSWAGRAKVVVDLVEAGRIPAEETV